eukprot:gene24272-32708_t
MKLFSRLAWFYEIDLRTKKSLKKILDLFKQERVDASAFHGVNGYGHGDIGREKLDNIVANLMGAEAALVRLQLFSGTHAISTALFACLRPGDEMLGISGHPYDTLEEVIGLRNGSQTGTTRGSLMDWGIGYQEIELQYEFDESTKITRAVFDLETIDKILNPVAINGGHPFSSKRSRDSARTYEKLIKAVEDLAIFVDNCYGELVEELEPCHVGADLVAGSLIKNLGGTLAPCGGYIAGNRELVNSAMVHLSAPGVDGGATFGMYRFLFQGLFNAPAVVGESLKGAELVAEIMQNRLGYPCNPPPGSPRTDIIQAVQLGDRKKLISFCEAVHSTSPVGSYIRPVPGFSPGYGEEVIFADGTFIDGSTLELSADGPLRDPFVAYTQGCTHWTHWALVLAEILQRKPFALSR